MYLFFTDLYAFVCRTKRDNCYIENPQVSQDIDIVYFPNCCTSFFTEAESDLEQLFSIYNNYIVESRMEGNEMKLIQMNILRDCYF